mgnify:CR=1 FL=1
MLINFSVKKCGPLGTIPRSCDILIDSDICVFTFGLKIRFSIKSIRNSTTYSFLVPGKSCGGIIGSGTFARINPSKLANKYGLYFAIFSYIFLYIFAKMYIFFRRRFSIEFGEVSKLSAQTDYPFRII